ncbi:MAG: hypothetical protein AAF682_30395 [Planctomycetota bacterium]
MPQRILFTLATLVILLSTGLATRAIALHSAPGLSYRIDLRRAPEEQVEITLRLQSVQGQRVYLSSLVKASLLEVEDLHARDVRGRALQVVPRGPAGDSPEPLRYEVVTEDPLDVVEVRYLVRPRTYIPPNGARDRRSFGVVHADGCLLSPANLVLVPALPPERVEFDVQLPTGWRALKSLPTVDEYRDTGCFWEHALIASPQRVGEHRLAPDVTMRFQGSPDPHLVDAIEGIAFGLTETLGPPREPVELIIAQLAHDAWVADLPGTLGFAFADLRVPDRGSLRRVARQLISHWYGRTSDELERDRSPEAWFPLGLREYVARRVVASQDPEASDGTLGLEHTWMRDASLCSMDLETADWVGSEALHARRFASATWLYELDLRLRDIGGLRGLLQGYDGRGLPRLPRTDPRAAELEAFLEQRRVDDPDPLSFEESWRVPYAPPRVKGELEAERLRTTSIVFTAGTRGALDSCDCGLTLGGGTRRQAQKLSELRAEDPDLLLFDLGGFAPVSPELAGLSTEEAEQFSEFLTVQSEMGYDALNVGPEELYSGVDRLRRAPLPELPFTAAGIQVGDESPYPAFRIFERDGVMIGYLAYSERYELGLRREVNEQNLLGVHIPLHVNQVVQELRSLRASVDLLVVGGNPRPSSLLRLCDPELGVDLVLLSNPQVGVPENGISCARLGNAIVVMNGIGPAGLNLVTLFHTAEGGLRTVHARTIELGVEGNESESISGTPGGARSVVSPDRESDK